MLPSLAGRLIAIFGLVCVCAGFYLAGWNRGSHDSPPHVFFMLAVAVMFAMRAAPKRFIDDNRLKSVVGERAIRRLSAWRAAGIAIVFIDLAPAFLALLIDSDNLRRGVLLGALAVLLVAVAILVWVEARYRALIRAAGGLEALTLRPR